MNYIDLSYTPLVYEQKYDCSNILLIDNSVQDYQTIVDAVNSNTMAIVYSYSSTKEDLSIVLSNFTTISRIAFAFSSNQNDPVIFLDNKPFFLFGPNVDNSSENLLFLIDIFEKYNVQYADYLGCNTLQYTEWNNYYNYLIQKTNISIGASNDKTGNIKYGGDWILENTSEDIETIYFTKNIDYYNYLLDTLNWATGFDTPAGIVVYDYRMYVGSYYGNSIIQIPINEYGGAGTKVTWYTDTSSLYAVGAFNGFIYTSYLPGDNITGPIIQIPINPDGTAGTANKTWIIDIIRPLTITSYTTGGNSYLFTSGNSNGIKRILINANNTAGPITTWYNIATTCATIHNSILYATLSGSNGIVSIPINSNGSAGTPTTLTTTPNLFGIASFNYFLYSNTYTGGASYIYRFPINENGSLGTINTTWKASSNNYLMTVGANPSSDYALYVSRVNSASINSFDLLVNIERNPTRILYKSGANIIDICNNFTSINLVKNPQFNGQMFSTGFFCYYNSIKYDLAQLYQLNSTIVTLPAINTNIFTEYNGSKYDINSFFNPNERLITLFSGLTTSSTNWNGCFSLKLLVSDYTGFIIKIRRASDSNTMSFYSTMTGILTSGTGGTGTTIATFLSATTGYVDTWYDQSGKNNHATQTVTASQPMINIVNNCLDFGYSNNANLFLNMPSGTVPVGILNASYSFVVKHGNSLNTVDGGFIGAGSASTNLANSFRFYTNIKNYQNYWWANDFIFGNTNTKIPIVAAVTYNGTTFTQKGYRDAVSTTTTTGRNGGTTANVTQTIGRTVANEYLKGEMYSLVIFSSELPQSDITILNTL